MTQPNPIGWWTGSGVKAADAPTFQNALHSVSRPVFVLQDAGSTKVADAGTAVIGETPPQDRGVALTAYVPPLLPEQLGEAGFRRSQGLRYAYIVGAMANGITSVEMVAAAARAGAMGFFGAAGLLPAAIETALDRLERELGGRPYGSNLIHNPAEPDLEMAVADLYVRRKLRKVSASAYLGLTLPLVYYRVKGIHQNPGGRIVCPNQVFGKVSRVEVAEKFLSPPPAKLLGQLVENGRITRQEAELARHVPMADALTAEADSGGHTDNRPAITLLPTMLALRDRVVSRYRYPEVPVVGLGGGIATPDAAAAAFCAGAAYVLTGSVNQACVESGTSETVRAMLADARQADVVMAPSADMFEMGVRVQVLKRGTMFPMRASKLYELYRSHDRYEDIPQRTRATLERDYFRCGFDTVWEQTRQFFQQRDPKQIDRADQNPRHKMALVFRSYLGRSSGWANAGDESRKMDYQIWCGPRHGGL
jgi:trans-AT polyketide synthase/acyltransferase/oxidoreductase domain-containing protein